MRKGEGEREMLPGLGKDCASRCVHEKYLHVLYKSFLGDLSPFEKLNRAWHARCNNASYALWERFGSRTSIETTPKKQKKLTPLPTHTNTHLQTLTSQTKYHALSTLQVQVHLSNRILSFSLLTLCLSTPQYGSL